MRKNSMPCKIARLQDCKKIRFLFFEEKLAYLRNLY